MLFSQENLKNAVMPNIRNEILNWIGNTTVTTDELHDFIKLQLSDTYEIGDAGVIINEMVAEELLIANLLPNLSPPTVPQHRLQRQESVMLYTNL